MFGPVAPPDSWARKCANQPENGLNISDQAMDAAGFEPETSRV
jgi:hypothetical protein